MRSHQRHVPARPVVTTSVRPSHASNEPFSAALLRRYRAVTAGRSQRLLAARIGVDHTTLSRWERGQDNIRLSTVDRIVGWVEREERRFAGRHVVSRTGPAVASSPRAAPSIPDVAAAAVTLEASILD